MLEEGFLEKKVINSDTNVVFLGFLHVVNVVYILH
jgi:hypothetical protein